MMEKILHTSSIKEYHEYHKYHGYHKSFQNTQIISGSGIQNRIQEQKFDVSNRQLVAHVVPVILVVLLVDWFHHLPNFFPIYRNLQQHSKSICYCHADTKASK